MSSNRAFSHLISIRWDCCNGVTPDAIISQLKDLLKNKFATNLSYEAPLGDGSIAILAASANSLDSNLTVIIRRYNKSELITLNIEYPVSRNQATLGIISYIENHFF